MKSNPEPGLSEFALSRRKLLVSLGALTAAAGVGGRLFVPSARAQSAGGVFVGKVDGTNAFVGIVTDGAQAEAYVCDGRDFKELFTGMLTDASNGRLTLMGEDGDLLPIDVDQTSLQTLLASGGSLSGGLTIGGSSNTFRADPAMGPGALYLSIGTLPDGSTMDGGTIVLNNGDLRGSIDATDGGDIEESNYQFDPETVFPVESRGSAPGGRSPSTAGGTLNENLEPLFSLKVSPGAPGGTSGGGSPPAGGGTRPAGGAPGAGTPPTSGEAPGSTPQINPQPIAQAVNMMQSGQALSGPNGPQPVPVPATVGSTTVNAMMVPQTPAKLAQNGPPH